jgi:hypothetical protein
MSQWSTIGRLDEFVPRDFDVPRRLETPQFVLEPLGPEQDYDAWTSSMDHRVPVTTRSSADRQAMKGMSSMGIVTKGRIMSRSSCSRMWQWYM